MIISFNDDSLARHKVSHRKALEVFRNPTTKIFALAESTDGSDCEMHVGFTDAGKLLEIGIEYQESANHVFHAQTVSPKFRKLFQEATWES